MTIALDGTNGITFPNNSTQTAGGSPAQAWVTFTVSGGVVTNRASFNVSSITYNATGDYSVNLTNALADTYYTMACSNSQSTGNAPCNLSLNTSRTSTSSVVQISVAQGGTRVDLANNMSIALFR